MFNVRNVKPVQILSGRCDMQHRVWSGTSKAPISCSIILHSGPSRKESALCFTFTSRILHSVYYRYISRFLNVSCRIFISWTLHRCQVTEVASLFVPLWRKKARLPSDFSLCLLLLLFPSIFPVIKFSIPSLFMTWWRNVACFFSETLYW